MRIISLLICLVSILASLAACQRDGVPRSGAPASPLNELELTRQLQIPAGTARAYFQHGAQSPSKDRYQPYCELEISTVAQQPQLLAPDTFAITGTMLRMVSDEDSGMPVRLTFYGGQDVFHEIHMRLSSRQQPGVRKLICRSWTQDLGRGRYLSIQEMQAVLGDTLLFK